jgi:hypothetical protein
MTLRPGAALRFQAARAGNKLLHRGCGVCDVRYISLDSAYAAEKHRLVVLSLFSAV